MANRSNKINDVARAADIGQNIKSIRGLRQMTQKELAAILGRKGVKCTNITLCNYERGKRLPSIEVLNIIAEIFRCDIGDIVGRRPVKEQPTADDIKALEKTLKFVKGFISTDSGTNR